MWFTHMQNGHIKLNNHLKIEYHLIKYSRTSKYTFNDCKVIFKRPYASVPRWGECLNFGEPELARPRMPFDFVFRVRCPPWHGHCLPAGIARSWKDFLGNQRWSATGVCLRAWLAPCFAASVWLNVKVPPYSRLRDCLLTFNFGNERTQYWCRYRITGEHHRDQRHLSRGMHVQWISIEARFFQFSYREWL